MNERINELLKQSTTDVKDEFGNWINFSVDQEKFAELIVRSCVEVVEKLSPGYNDYRNQIEDAFRGDCVEEIKQHFGVK